MTGSVLNILIKLAAVLLAVLLWFNVITQKQYEDELVLPVTDIELPPTLGLVTPLPDSLTIRVMAEGKKLLRNDWKRAGLRVKAGRLKRGVNSLEINMETVLLVRPEHVTMLDLPGASPIMVRLDRIDSILKPVASRLAIIPADGYMVLPDQGGISPLQTQVIGPAVTLMQIDSVFTEQRILDGISETAAITLDLAVPDEPGISLGHDSAVVEVVIDKAAEKRFENIPVVVIVHTSGRRPIVDPDRVTIQVQGPESLLDSLTENMIQVRVAPPAAIRSGYTVPEVVLPANVTLTDLEPDSIRILITP